MVFDCRVRVSPYRQKIEREKDRERERERERKKERAKEREKERDIYIESVYE